MRVIPAEATPQILPTDSPETSDAMRSVTTGCEIAVRGWPWRLTRVWRGDRCSVFDVSALTRGAPDIRAFVDPFDSVRARPAVTRWRRGSRGRLRQEIARLAGGWPEMPVSALSALTVPLWPHQVSPVLSLLDGRAVRLLIADEVGLGKTVSAALVMSELIARGVARRVLVVTPAGLRDQWQHELALRARLDSTVVDRAALATRVKQRRSGESAWMEPGIAIVSMDFARQPGVLAGLVARPWDLLVVDEAHQVSSDSARAAAMSRVARCSRVVLLLSATPHTGDPSAFERLQTLGGHGAPALRFHHARQRSGDALPRRTRRWRIAPTSAERRMLDVLGAYARRVERTDSPEARLAMIVLRKRALSSAEALRRTLQHRRGALADVPGHQLVLPLDLDAGEHDGADDELPAWLGAPGLPDRSSEIAALDRLIALATEASGASSKWRTVRRLVRHTAEPVILFTEFRDTLRALIPLIEDVSFTVLHGGLDRHERGAAVERFTTGHARVLVATDAAAEGLNLHARCRLVVNVELPWSPRVLEQRAGRIDRIGQTRAVHIWELVGRAGHDAMVTAALARRLSAITNGLESRAETAPAGQGANSAAGIEASAVGSRDDFVRWWNLRAAAQRIAPAAPTPRKSRGMVWMRAKRLGPVLQTGVLVVYTSRLAGVGAGVQHVAVHVRMSRWPPGSPSAWLPAVADLARPVAAAHLRSDEDFKRSLAEREAELLDFVREAHDVTTRRWQPSFFDRRAERVVQAAHRDLAYLTEEHERRRAELTAPAAAPSLEPCFALLVP